MMARIPFGVFQREYYYYFSERGHLFHIYDLPGFAAGRIPSGPTYLREERFLDFFLTHLRFNESTAIDEPGRRWFPYLSRCGPKEANFVALHPSIGWVGSDASRPPGSFAAAPVLFSRLERDTNGSALCFGGNLRQPFHHEQLKVDRNGYLYHPITVLPHLKSKTTDLVPTPTADRIFLGLISSSLCVELGLDYVEEETQSLTGAPADDLLGGGGPVRYHIRWNAQLSPIDPIVQARPFTPAE